MSIVTHKRIQQLPIALANQIAAGEVVERPASVLKECLENSIDSGAKKITIEIEAGGIDRIKIVDDGNGIVKEDLPLAVASHATSKISTQSDLSAILSLGFRGEALASISAVAKMQIASKALGNETAYCLESAPGKAPQIAPCAHPAGTTVEVEALFHTLPARRKFLKSPKTEKLRCEEVFKRVALSQFSIGFTWIVDGKISKQLPPCQTKAQKTNRIKLLCGAAFAEEAFCIETQQTDLAIWGWIGDPLLAKSQVGVQYFFVNGRVIRDKVITHAVKQAYLPFCAAGQHPEFILFLACPPEEVDVNVHPTKHEVRFEHARIVHAFIVESLTKALGSLSAASGQQMPVAPLSSLDAHFERYANISSTGCDYKPTSKTSLPSNNITDNATNADLMSFEKIGFLFDRKYFLALYQQALMVFDVHALYKEKWQTELHTAPEPTALLNPIPVGFVGAQDQADNFQTQLTPFGFECALGGPDLFLIQAVPNSMQAIADVAFFQDVFTVLKNKKTPLDRWLLSYLAEHHPKPEAPTQQLCLNALSHGRHVLRLEEPALSRLMMGV